MFVTTEPEFIKNSFSGRHVSFDTKMKPFVHHAGSDSKPILGSTAGGVERQCLKEEY
jgi:hypothetical protein